MAPPAKLPLNFNGWDKGGTPPPTLPADFNGWDDAYSPAVPPSGQSLPAQEKPLSFTEGIQKSFDDNTRTNPNEPLLETGLKSVVGAIGAPFVHPRETAKGIARSIPSSPDLPEVPMRSNGKTYLRDPENPLVQRGEQAYTDAKDNGLAYSATKLGGELFGGLVLDKAFGAAPKAARGMADITRKAMPSLFGDPDAAALRGLRVGPGSKRSISTLRAVEGSRPFLQGADSLADLQSRIGPAKDEIWGPYKSALDKVGDLDTRLGKVKDLEARRLELSGQLRLVKSSNPSDIALAQQQGLNKAALLDEERQINSVLTPILQEQGIDPIAIRRSYGDVGRVGRAIEGRSTLTEQPKPYGFGRVANDFSFSRPQKVIPAAIEGAKDIMAGRPLWSGKPTDVAIREGFRSGGPKPNFRIRSTPYDMPEPAGLLEASNIAEPGGEDFTQGGIPPRPTVITPPPTSRMGLPASSGAGVVQPMVGVRITPPPGLAEDYARTRIIEPEYLEPPKIPSRGFVAGPDGTVRGNPLFLNSNEPAGLLQAPARIPRKRK